MGGVVVTPGLVGPNHHTKEASMRRFLRKLLECLRESQRIQRDSAAWEMLRHVDS